MLSVIARAEFDRTWEEVLARLGEATAGSELELVQAEACPGGGQAWLSLGPVADPVQLDLREGLLLAQARSGPWGPGYHQAAVEVVESIGARFGGWAGVQDTTDYYRERDRAALERSFLRAAHALWEPGPWSPQGPARGLLVGLDPGQAPARVPPGLVATPTGFKDAGWIERVRAALREAIRHGTPPSLAAREAFLWWAPEPDAFDWVQLGRVLCACEVIWRPLEGDSRDTPAQIDVRQRALDCFARALQLDPAAPVPRAELHRLGELLGSDELPALSADAREREPFQGGYREGFIRRQVGAAWRVQLPGWLRAGYDAGDGHDVFWDSGFTVHLTVRRHARAFQRQGEIARHLACLPPGARSAARVILIDQAPIEGYAIVLQAQALGAHGEAELVVSGQVASGHERVSFTAVARSPETSALALELPRSFSFAAS